MNTSEIKHLQQERNQLRLLLRDYYAATQIGHQMEDPTDYDRKNYETLMDALQQRAVPLLGSEEEDAAEDLECACGNTIVWLMRFFGPDYMQQHLKECGACGQQSLHVSDASERCVNPDCKHRAGIDAEGNLSVTGEIVSNGGKSVDQLRDEYFEHVGLLQ